MLLGSNFPLFHNFSIYICNLRSKIPIFRPPFGLPKSGLNREVVLILNKISSGKYHLGLGKTGLNSEVVLILGGLNSDILLYLYLWYISSLDEI